MCIDGACVATSATPGDLVLTVDLPEDSTSAPGRTYAALLADVLQTASLSGQCSDARCVHLPSGTQITGAYTVLGTTVQSVESSLFAGFASLPSHVTYRALWPPDASSPADDALGAGLPLLPVQASTSLGSMPGPGGGPPVGFQTYLLTHAPYARIISPDAPFDRDFPPDVHVVSELSSPSSEVVSMQLDETTLGTQHTLPTFALSRTDKPLDGFTAYLRDAATKIVLSPVKPLSGMSTPDGGVLLPTNHVPTSAPSTDALIDTELVMAPPQGEATPAEVFSYPGTTSGQETFAVLPAATLPLAGAIDWGDEQPVSATVVFEAAAIYASQPPTGDVSVDGEAGAPMAVAAFQPQPNFEYTTQVQAQPDAASGSGESTYSVQGLPRGLYRVTIRPNDPRVADASSELVHAVTVVDCFDTTDGTMDAAVVSPHVVVPLAPVVPGTATIADGRPLGGATVEAIGTGCVPSTGSCPALPDSANCMPRSAETITNPDGSFSLPLDPGSYRVTLEPPDGSRLPRVSQSISVPFAGPLAFTVFAPVHLHLQIADFQGPLVANAVVRLFAILEDGPAVEVGLAFTDASGRFDMYLDPTLQ